MITYAYELKEHLAKKGDDFIPTDEEKRKQLLELVEDSEMTDNPVLMVVSLKE